MSPNPTTHSSARSSKRSWRRELSHHQQAKSLRKNARHRTEPLRGQARQDCPQIKMGTGLHQTSVTVLQTRQMGPGQTLLPTKMLRHSEKPSLNGWREGRLRSKNHHSPFRHSRRRDIRRLKINSIQFNHSLETSYYTKYKLLTPRRSIG